MTSRRTYLTTAIPYVNGDPHVGFALELVRADVLARHRRLRGEEVRFLTGTDENALKNVEAAGKAGIAPAAFVAGKAARFAALRDVLELSTDDFIRTSVDPRHRPGVERLWRACAAAGDLYLRDYEGGYCDGCEAFLGSGDLVRGRCPEHGRRPERVRERNWFFRLGRHRPALLDALRSGRLRVEPAERLNEVLAFVAAGLDDVSLSRSAERARGWGIPVPGDPSQVVYVWFDALANYLTALGYGSGAADYRRWWLEADERLHVIGKGILRFHAVYWPAILLSAGEPLPTTILVHDYVTVNGGKLSKSGTGDTDPEALAARHGADALRWWLVRDVPRAGDVDFREELLPARADELADELGNLVSRVVALAARRSLPPAAALRDAPAAPARARAEIDAALACYDVRGAATALRRLVADGNRTVARTRPWELARAASANEDAARRLDLLLGDLLALCRAVAEEAEPFLPRASQRLRRALDELDPGLARSLFRKSGGD